MGNIFTILLRIFPFITFIILEVISFYTISNYNDYYKSNIVSRSNSIVGGFYKEVNSYKNYFSLKEVNEKLLLENASLKNQLYADQLELNRYHDDSVYSTVNQFSNYQVIPAKIIKNSISSLRNYIIIDKGSKDGIAKDMGAISDRGPIGPVIEVSENYSCIMSFINKDAIIGARVKSTNHIGILRWAGGDERIANLDEIPKHIKLKVGDEIVTNGHSSYFPENIPIGKVVKQVESKQNNFAEIKVQLYNDFSSMKYLYIIVNKQQAARKVMEDKIIELQSTNKNEQ